MPSTKTLLFALLLGIIVGIGITTEYLFVSTAAFTTFFYLVLTKTDLGNAVLNKAGKTSKK